MESINEQIRRLNLEKQAIVEKARETIDNEKEWVDIKPYSHNIISLTLRAVAKKCGNEEANKLIDDFGLTELGWNKQ